MDGWMQFVMKWHIMNRELLRWVRYVRKTRKKESSVEALKNKQDGEV